MSIAELEELKLKLKDNTLTPEEKKSLKNKIKNKQKKINEKNKNKSIFPPFCSFILLEETTFLSNSLHY